MCVDCVCMHTRYTVYTTAVIISVRFWKVELPLRCLAQGLAQSRSPGTVHELELQGREEFQDGH